MNNLSRTPLAIIFISFLLLSLFYFFSKDNRKAYSIQTDHQQSTYLSLYDLIYLKYKKQELVKYLISDKASLTSIDKVELLGNVHGWRTIEGDVKKNETIEASAVHVNISSKTLADFEDVVKVKDILFFGGVSLKRDNIVIYTQTAHYLGSENPLVVGNDPVHAQLNNQSIDSERGFKLDLQSEVINLIGPVKGVILPHEKLKK